MKNLVIKGNLGYSLSLDLKATTSNNYNLRHPNTTIRRAWVYNQLKFQNILRKWIQAIADT